MWGRGADHPKWHRSGSTRQAGRRERRRNGGPGGTGAAEEGRPVGQGRSGWRRRWESWPPWLQVVDRGGRGERPGGGSENLKRTDGPAGGGSVALSAGTSGPAKDREAVEEIDRQTREVVVQTAAGLRRRQPFATAPGLDLTRPEAVGQQYGSGPIARGHLRGPEPTRTGDRARLAFRLASRNISRPVKTHCLTGCSSS